MMGRLKFNVIFDRDLIFAGIACGRHVHKDGRKEIRLQIGFIPWVSVMFKWNSENK